MNSREVLLVVYAGILGWYLHDWWRGKREQLVWDAAERAAARVSCWAAVERQASQQSNGDGQGADPSNAG